MVLPEEHAQSLGDRSAVPALTEVTMVSIEVETV